MGRHRSNRTETYQFGKSVKTDKAVQYKYFNKLVFAVIQRIIHCSLQNQFFFNFNFILSLQFGLRTMEFDMEHHPTLIAIAVLVIISNMFAIVLFVTKKTLRKGGNLLLLSLAISDVATGLITIPLNIGCEFTYSLGLCMSSGILNRFLAISTVYHILAITFETYYAIPRPIEHRVM